MGAADVVPGVSGGTIAFITGIYEELLHSISSVRLSLFTTWKTEGFLAAWKQLNGKFLIVLLAGIFTSIFSLAQVISYMLENKAVMLWAFFFGLVLASVWLVGKEVGKWKGIHWILAILGATIAWWITSLPPLSVKFDNGSMGDYFYLFLSGMIAICAMILPGISGSFILLILGSYTKAINAVKELDVAKIAVFAAGAIIGLLAFSRVLNYLFEKFRAQTIAVLTGFLVGSLNKIWPWKENAKLLYTHSDGKQDFLQANVLPNDYTGDPQIMSAILAFIVGILVIVAMEIVARKMEQKN